MAKKETTCVLIPLYNESRTIAGIIEALKKRGLPVYVIDDGSTDDTGVIAKRAGAVVLTHERNKGKGASLREGFRHILKDGYESVIVMDGDGQHHHEDLDNFFRKVGETKADIIIGNRMLDTSKMPVTRFLTNKFMSYLISKLTGQYIPDTQCGFRMIQRHVLERVHLVSSNYETESELLFRAAKKNFRIESVAIRTIYGDETSQIHPVRDTWRFVLLLVRIMRERSAG